MLLLLLSQLVLMLLRAWLLVGSDFQIVELARERLSRDVGTALDGRARGSNGCQGGCVVGVRFSAGSDGRGRGVSGSYDNVLGAGRDAWGHQVVRRGGRRRIRGIGSGATCEPSANGGFRELCTHLGCLCRRQGERWRQAQLGTGTGRGCGNNGIKANFRVVRHGFGGNKYPAVQTGLGQKACLVLISGVKEWKTANGE